MGWAFICWIAFTSLWRSGGGCLGSGLGRSLDGVVELLRDVRRDALDELGLGGRQVLLRRKVADPAQNGPWPDDRVAALATRRAPYQGVRLVGERAAIDACRLRRHHVLGRGASPARLLGPGPLARRLIIIRGDILNLTRPARCLSLAAGSLKGIGHVGW